MPRYSDERREAVLRKMLPPHNRSVVELAEEEGISAATLYLWRKQARAEGRLLPDGDSAPEGWSSADKFAAVLETGGSLEDICDRLIVEANERGGNDNISVVLLRPKNASP